MNVIGIQLTANEREHEVLLQFFDEVNRTAAGDETIFDIGPPILARLIRKHLADYSLDDVIAFSLRVFTELEQIVALYQGEPGGRA